eukprot:jgi/Chrzof1/9592/Cz04g08200.t1
MSFQLDTPSVVALDQLILLAPAGLQVKDLKQQLAKTQRSLKVLQSEYHEYVEHSSTVITRLQSQLQQLVGQPTLSALPGLASGLQPAPITQTVSRNGAATSLFQSECMERCFSQFQQLPCPQYH